MGHYHCCHFIKLFKETTDAFQKWWLITQQTISKVIEKYNSFYIVTQNC